MKHNGPKKRRLRRLAIVCAGTLAMLVGVAAALDRVFPPDLGRYYDRSAMVLDSDGRVLRAFTAADGAWRLPAAVGDASPLYLRMLINYEDRRFAWHPGVDPIALARAFGQWVVNGRLVSGASTLTMQTARLLEPRPRDLGSKLLEMARAVQLELHYGKDEILAMYLTLAPMGGNLEGVRAASWAYFGKPPDMLDAAEAALLTVLPQSPTRHRPDRHPEAARAARDKVLARARDAGIIDAAEAARAMAEPVPDLRRPMPFLAPHLARALVAQSDADIVRTTIERDLQRALEDLASRAVGRLDRRANLGLLVVDNATRRIVAHIGSAGFFDAARAGQVDMTQAVRSPGSTLKPFIYGLGFEDLLIHPRTMISDAPLRFGDYNPLNFDGGFRGRISVREALQRSLNVPAVAVLNRVGPTRLRARLEAAGANLAFPDGMATATLPLALGGVGVSLHDLTMLYAALANGGEATGLRALADGGGPVATNMLLQPAAAWYVTDILAGMAPPDGVVDPAFAGARPRIAYKTGTSYGYRDAWAVGYTADFTIGVWVGRPDGAAVPGQTGRDAAAPILFEAFGLLPPPANDVVPPPPADVAAAPPARLAEFGRPGALAPPPGVIRVADDLEITFPIDGAVIALAGGDQLDTLPLTAKGGARPLRWLVDGRPIASSPLRREAEWRPHGAGQVRITVIDANGDAASAAVWVR